ncbi:helix-turn-helix domain-containing protein [uncultured Eubacterium sp.]|uniref:helix-turn-helix domain-containing protein n=1 Tax=uncultured Eubacterium sp. TaxID=165185 RepID=UPI0025917DEF|nr:helix-turn-helix transcriptional regulator [uncultured Eubacterium sp.]
MKLAEKIMTLRKQRGWSQEELAQQLSVSRQSVSKWESGASVPDLDKILKMSAIFNVSTDILLKEELDLNERNTVVGDVQTEQMKMDPFDMTNSASDQSGMQQFGEDTRREEIPTHHVSMREAKDYLEWAKHKAPWIAFGTFLCVLSPVWLLVLSGMAEYKVLPITEDMAGGMGVAILLGIVAVAVAIFIIKGAHQERFRSFETQHIVAEEEVRSMVLEEKQEFAPLSRKCTVTGVILSILSVVPMMLMAAFSMPDIYYIYSIAVLLIFVAIATFFFVWSGTITGSYQILLEEEDYSLKNKQSSGKRKQISRIYWCSVTAIFLAVSFLTNRWDLTWIIWACAGVLCGAVSAIMSLSRR